MADPLSRPGGGRHAYLLAWLGAATLTAGLLADVVEHLLIPHLHDAGASVAFGQPAAHVATAIGFVIAAAGIGRGILPSVRLAAAVAPHDPA